MSLGFGHLFIIYGTFSIITLLLAYMCFSHAIRLKVLGSHWSHVLLQLMCGLVSLYVAGHCINLWRGIF